MKTGNLFLFLFGIAAAVTLIVSGITLFSMKDTVDDMNSAHETLDTTEKLLTYNYELRLQATAIIAQTLLSERELKSLEPGPNTPATPEGWIADEGFKALRSRLDEFTSDHNLAYVYYYFRIDNLMQPVIDNDPDLNEAYTPANDLIKLDEAMRQAWNEKKVVVENAGGSFVDPDSLVTAYAPVLSSDGEVIALAGVDIKDEQLNSLHLEIESLSAHTESLSKRMRYLIITMITALALLVTAGILNVLANMKRTAALGDALLRAERASRAKSDFLANMSHEMRTPLNAVIGMTAIAQKSDEVDKKEYCLNKIEEASTHLLGVINDVLDYSKIEAEKFDLTEAPFNFEVMLRKACDVISFKAAEKHQVFDIDIDPSIPRMVMGDEQHITQVIANFLSNAVKFTPEEGSISLSARMEGEKDGCELIRVEVKDSGIGISEEQKTRLFHSFEQADNTITKRFGGTGLGLAISKRIVEMMNGEIYLESEFGAGSTFGFIAPFAPYVNEEETIEIAREPEAEAEDYSEVDYSAFDILLVDDVSINREIVIAMLEDTRINIESAENGAEAVKKFCAEPGRFKLIFMDVQMPEMDGYEATRRIRALEVPEAKTVPIIAMTANAFRDDVSMAIESGMNAHMAKPLDFLEVHKKLQEYL